MGDKTGWHQCSAPVPIGKMSERKIAVDDYPSRVRANSDQSLLFPAYALPVLERQILSARGLSAPPIGNGVSLNR